MVREKLKVNIIINGDHILTGAQAADCDPKMTTRTGTLQNALERIPSFVEESSQQWVAAPRNPKSTMPEPIAPLSERTATTPTITPAKPASAKPAQPNFF